MLRQGLTIDTIFDIPARLSFVRDPIRRLRTPCSCAVHRLAVSFDYHPLSLTRDAQSNPISVYVSATQHDVKL